MSNEIVTVNADKIAKFTGYSSEEIAIIKNTVAKGTSDTELAYFLSVSKSVGLNPFNKEVWCYKDNKNNLLVFTGRDGFLSKAQSSPAYNGIRSCEVCDKDEFSMDIANNKILHKFGKVERGNIIGAYAIVFRKDGEPTIEWADFKTYNKGWNTWKTNPADMIKKVAESHALKKAFGISGIQSEYDFDVRGGVAVPLDHKDNELDSITKILIDEIDKLELGLQAMYKDDLEKARKSGKFDIPFVNEMIKKVQSELSV